jgi:hypothetical protein
MGPVLSDNKKSLSTHLWLGVKALNLDADPDMDPGFLLEPASFPNFWLSQMEKFLLKQIIASWAMFLRCAFSVKTVLQEIIEAETSSSAVLSFPYSIHQPINEGGDKEPLAGEGTI